MKILVTGSAGHLSEALVRTLLGRGHAVVGIDVIASEFTHRVGSIVDRSFVVDCLGRVAQVFRLGVLIRA
ncbi:MAG: hypothetical protein DHS20C16_34780 [Phycisphaerae bacterium]|nr:MAG: hypothetical protein DHS20C16_34780 [Phycisphaerae bacterium]